MIVHSNILFSYSSIILIGILSNHCLSLPFVDAALSSPNDAINVDRDPIIPPLVSYNHDLNFEDSQMREYVLLEITEKIDTILQLIQKGFDKVNEKLLKLESKMDNLDSEADKTKTKFQNKLDEISQTTNRQMTKVFNIFNETYSLTKELSSALSFDLKPKSTIPSFSNANNQDDEFYKQKKLTETVNDSEFIEIQNGDEDNEARKAEERAKYRILEDVAGAAAKKYSSELKNNIREEFNIVEVKLRNIIEDIKDTVINNSVIADISKKQSDIQYKVEIIIENVKSNGKDAASIFDKVVEVKSDVKNKAVNILIEKKFDLTKNLLINLFAEHYKNITNNKFNCLQNNVTIDDSLLSNNKSVDFYEIQSSGIHKNVALTSTIQNEIDKKDLNFDFRSRSNDSKDPFKYLTRDLSNSHGKNSRNNYTFKNSYRPTFVIKRPSRHDRNCNGKIEGFPESCLEIYKQKNGTCDRVYVVAHGNRMEQVYCSDMQPYSNFIRGWTVILRHGRVSPKCGRKYCDMEFERDNREYYHGFGDMHGAEFFIGLQRIEKYTKNQPHFLQIDLEDFKGDWASFRYRNFRIGNSPDFEFLFDGIEPLSEEESNLSPDKYMKISQSLLSLNGSIFVSRNKPEGDDLVPESLKDCLKSFKCNWWIKKDKFKSDEIIDCDSLVNVNLFAPLPDAHEKHLFWNGWASLTGDDKKIRNAVMKIRPIKESNHVHVIQTGLFSK